MEPAKLKTDDLSKVSIGVSGSDLFNHDIRNSVSYSNHEVLTPSAGGAYSRA